MKRILAAIALVAFTATPAFAQDEPSKKVTEYNYEDDVVTGKLKKPSDELVSGELGPKAPSLLTPRLTFVNEVIKSAEQL